ncbi:prostate stem cell antigen-like [Fundulus heteroclitus]|uniref:prostate stem cell antigen-like n=1 Tax=Fundulus heteroclitus TaxID=8078 RepID=UPI00165A3E25|nr:prostate stem cell antigen-like [Fundulus heteroclitus]
MSLLHLLSDRAEKTQMFKMKLYGPLIFLLTVSAAYGLKCYQCINAKPESCKSIESCTNGTNQCYSIKVPVLGTVTKGCKPSAIPCISPTTCCEGNLCNGATPTAPGVYLLLMSSALFVLSISGPGLVL